jgi:predicted kinase
MIRLLDLLNEGVYDPNILKCVFLAGGPGSGKSTVANDLFGIGSGLKHVSVAGLKTLNSDTQFEHMLKKHGIDSKQLAQIERDNPELFKHITEDPNGVRSMAKQQFSKLKSFYEQSRLGLIMDGTGDDYAKIRSMKEHAETLGYDTFMVFVNTALEVALERNKYRDRVLPERIVIESWKACQENLGKFQSLFSGSFRIVDNSSSVKVVNMKMSNKGYSYKTEDRVASDVQKSVAQFIRQPLRNPIGKAWIQTQLALKNAKIIK